MCWGEKSNVEEEGGPDQVGHLGPDGAQGVAKPHSFFSKQPPCMQSYSWHLHTFEKHDLHGASLIRVTTAPTSVRGTYSNFPSSFRGLKDQETP